MMSLVIHGYSAAQIRSAEEPLLAAEPPGALMERAAFALAVRVCRELRARRGRVAGAVVVALVGSGNNGGDALFAGAELARRGVRVLAVLASTRVHDAGLAALRSAGGRAVLAADAGPSGPEWIAPVLAELAAADVVLDGLLGIGARGAPSGAAADVIALVGGLLAAAAGHPEELHPAEVDAAMLHPAEVDAAIGRAVRPDRRVRPLVVAVDVPSGIGVDDGAVPSRALTRVLSADLTVTFGAGKAGLLLPPASALAGRVEVIEIGLDLAGQVPTVARLERADVAALWPVPGATSHKYSRGVLGVVAGTPMYPGAAVLTVTAAVCAGVAMVRYLGPPGGTAAVLAARPEVVAGHGRVQAWVVGPGVAPDDPPQAGQVRDALAAAHAEALPAVVDAGGLTLLPDRLDPWIVLTPHAGELARLLTERGEHVDRAAVEAAPLAWARRAHELTGATVLLKGATTVVVGAHGAVYTQQDAPAWLATAGSGDVLAGILGALLAGRAADVVADPTLAAALAAAAACTHGRAAYQAQPGGPVSALAVAHALPATIASILADPAMGDWPA